MSSVKVFRGDTWHRTWVITDAQNAPVNLAGASARVQVRNKDTDALLVNASTSNGFLIFQVPDGRIDMVVPKEQMVLPPGDYVFDVEVTFANGVRKTYEKEKLIVIKDVSHD